MSSLRQIAFYGKGGIGKSTTSQNTLAALAEMPQDPDRGLRSQSGLDPPDPAREGAGHDFEPGGECRQR